MLNRALNIVDLSPERRFVYRLGFSDQIFFSALRWGILVKLNTFLSNLQIATEHGPKKN